MGAPTRRLRMTAAAGLAASLILGVAACSADDGGSNQSGKTTITLQWFGSPGLDQAVKDFEALNPDIKVNSENRGQLRDFGIGQSTRTVNDNGVDGPGGGELVIRASVDVGNVEVRR